jgi:ABC-2 type transport system permease protein
VKLWVTIKKDIRILIRDKIGLIFMFGMPILLVIVVTIIQNNTFDLLSKNKIQLIVCNQDTGTSGAQFIQDVDTLGMFRLVEVPKEETRSQFIENIRDRDALLGIIIPGDFSNQVNSTAKTIASKALNSFGLQGDTVDRSYRKSSPISFYYDPILQESFRFSIREGINSALQMVESKQILKRIFFSINEKPLSDSLENVMLQNEMVLNQISLSRSGNNKIPNASQHNIPAWTIFAMFFVVLSLGSSIVREKSSGSFIRLKTLPTNYSISLLSKQITYLGVTLFQATVIFAIGLWVFPFLGLPELILPSHIIVLLLVTFICGWCAVSYAICVGVFARTQEQANGFGAVSVIILAVIGGLMVPSFAMPVSFKTVMIFSPLHWALEAYYGIFVEGGKLKDVITNIIPLFVITVFIQIITFLGLKRKNLI